MPEPSAPLFRRAVVALSGNPNGQRLIRVVAEVAKVNKAELIGVHVVEIDWSMPLDMDVAGRSEEIQQVLDVAEGTAESLGVKLESVLLQARDVGAALVDEAIERDADLLVVGLAYRTKFGGDFAMGRTIPYVLKNAPCAVWVVREPIPEENP
ncbi:MAG TPA: universal stress protein [Candidatus Limnocylindrales bacterium]|nr:universal stress protein [Candidatus Limnocylindrales bacterium]